MQKALAGLVLGGFFIGAVAQAASVEVITRDDFELIPLNPLRGDASPKAGVLWGDLRADMPTGALIQFADGFASPPHIHNITYRAVVIEGTVHNDDPNAENLWMEVGSFWTQPAGETHITSVGPGGGLAFLEIESGPYLVQPATEAFDNGERPVNVEARNVVWLSAVDTSWIEHDSQTDSPEMAFLWGKPADGHRYGTFVRLPTGYEAILESGAAAMQTVLITGDITHATKDAPVPVALSAGSYAGSEGEVSHALVCVGSAPCLLYISANGIYRVKQAQ